MKSKDNKHLTSVHRCTQGWLFYKYPSILFLPFLCMSSINVKMHGSSGVGHSIVGWCRHFFFLAYLALFTSFLMPCMAHSLMQLYMFLLKPNTRIINNCGLVIVFMRNYFNHALTSDLKTRACILQRRSMSVRYCSVLDVVVGAFKRTETHLDLPLPPTLFCGH